MTALRSLLVSGLGLLVVLAGTAIAHAHAGLISAAPAAGSVLATVPAVETLVFTEPVAPIGFSLAGVDSPARQLGWSQSDGPRVDIALPPDLADGSYVLSWRVTSADGHPVNGTVDFAVGAANGTVSVAAGPAWLAPAVWGVRAAHYFALFFGVGSLAMATLLGAGGAARRPARLLVGLGLALLPVALALQGLDLTGDGLAALAGPEPWQAALATPYALTLGALALAFVLALGGNRWTALAAGLLGAAAPLLSGHVVTAPPQGVMRATLFVHQLALMFWLGALLPLLVLLRQDDAAPLRRFSHLVPLAVAALLGSGVVMAVVQMGPLPADWASAYGVLLAAKLALVAVLLGLALWNRVRLTAPALAGASRPLRRAIIVELGLVALIFAVVAGWRFTPPPRVLAEIAAAQAPLSASLADGGGASAALTATPGRPGAVQLELAYGGPAESVTLRLANAEAGIATISRQASRVDADGWRVASVLLPAGGDWQVAAAIRVSDFELKTLTGTLAFPATGKDQTMPTRTIAAIAMGATLLATPALAANGVLPSCPTGQSFTAGDITVSGAFSRATLKGAPTAGGYLSIANAGSDADTFTGASTEAATKVDIHSMKMNGDVMEMAPVEGGLEIPAGGSVSLDPMGYHLMMTGLAQGLAEGQCVEMVLHFARAGDLPVAFNVGGIAQRTPPGSAAGASAEMDMDMQMDMDMSGMSHDDHDMGSMDGMDDDGASSMAM